MGNYKSVAASKRLKLSQFDVKRAFLYGELAEEICMVQLEVFSDGANKVCRLYKSIYRLKQDQQYWNECFKRFAKKCWLQRLFYTEDKSPLLIVYVNDGIVITRDEEIAKQFLKKLET